MRRQSTRQAANGTQVEWRALALIAAVAAVIMALTFRTWVDLTIASIRGVDTDAMTNFGDGYLVISLAIIAIICAGVLYLRPTLWTWLLPGIGATAIGIAAIAAYQAGIPWHAAGSDMHGDAFVTSGHATAAVYEVFALAAAMGLAAAALAGVQYQRQLRSSEGMPQDIVKGLHHDQPKHGTAGRLGPR